MANDDTKNNPDEMSEEDRLLAEWEAMAEETDVVSLESIGNSQINTAKLLNQDEIDSLLGFEEGDLSGGKSGIESIINSAMVSYERLPMLEVIFDRFVRVLSTSLRLFTSDNVEVSLDNITSVRFGDYLQSIPLPSMLTIFKVEEWDNFGLMNVDSALIYSIVDVLLGGRKGSAPMRVEGRPYTTIERNLVERMVKIILADLTVSFDILSAANFVFDRLETNPRFATIARPANAAVYIRLKVDMEERGGKIDIVIPYATLEPVRDQLLQMFMGERFGQDFIWEGHLGGQLLQTDMSMDVILDRKQMFLGDVLNWKIGSQIQLKVGPDSDVDLVCGEKHMFSGKMGNNGENIAVKISHVLEKEK